MTDYLERVLNSINGLIYVSDIKTGEILFVNQKMEEEFKLKDAKGKICWQVLRKGMEEVCECCPVYRLQLLENEPIEWEEYNTVTGRYYHNTNRLIDWVDGRRAHIQYSADITEQKQAMLKLRQMLDACPLGCHFRNSRYELVDCNIAAMKLFGYSSKREYLTDGIQGFYSRLKPDVKMSREETLQMYDKVREEGRLRKELILEDRNGSCIPCEVTMECLKNEDDFVIVSYMRDLREIVEKEERIEETEKLNKFDGLTGIYSKRIFMEEARRLLDFCKRQEIMFSTILFSIDRFKRINREYGHAVGDGMILMVSEIMKKKLNRNNVYGRSDGAGFLICLTGYDASGSWKLAEEIREEVEAACYYPREYPIRPTISMGISVRREETKDMQELLDEAGKAMYDARMEGYNCIRLYDKPLGRGVSIQYFN